MKPSCILLFLLFTGLWLPAQQRSVFRTDRLGTKDGLSHRWSRCVTQDAKGYIWVGTYDGLNRYDGNNFLVYRPSATGKYPFSADYIYQISETADGKFYLASYYGVLRFDPETEEFELLLKWDDRDRIIVLIPEGSVPFLVSKWRRNDVPIVIYQLLPSGALSLLSNPPQNLSQKGDFVPVQCDLDAAWFWDFQKTYHRFDLKNKVWSSFPIAGSANAPIDESGHFWLPDGTKLRSVQLPENMRSVHWSSFNIEPGKALWLYAESEQDVYTLFRFDLKDNSLTTAIPSLSYGDFNNIKFIQPASPSHYLDKEGTVWFASFLGLFKIRRTDNLFRHYMSKPVEHIEVPPTDISARQMLEDAAGNIYMRAANPPPNFYKINPETGAVKPLNLPKTEDRNDETYRNIQKFVQQENMDWSVRVFSIAADQEGFIWLATYMGLYRYDPTTETFRHYYFPTILPPYIWVDGGNRIWFSTEAETWLFDKETGQFQHIGNWNLREAQPAVMLPEENTLWGFTDTGLIKINTLNFDTRYIPLYKEPREQRCLVSHHGWLWVGTSRGLEKINPTTFSHTLFDRSKGLPGNFIYGMVADGDYLWLGTSDGLCRFNVETETVKNFYVEDGLSHNEFNTTSAFKARNGKIFMGGLNGINAFSPSNLAGKTDVKSRILLSRFSLFNAEKDSLIFFSPKSIAAGIELPPSVTSIYLQLAITSFIDPGKNQYAWRMDGLDEDWYYGGNQFVAAYRHIPPGTYTFRAKAADAFGNWSENELSLRITVLGPWYSRWWAWLTYVLLLSAAVFSLYRFQLSKKLEHAENLRLLELDGFKNRFFTNITHEFRTPLTVILGNLELEKLELEKLEKTEPSRLAQFFQFMFSKNALTRRNAESLLHLINQVLDLAKLESQTLKINYVQGNVLPYLRYIAESLQSVANVQNVLLQVESTKAEIRMDYDPERFMQIVHNLLSNAIKFTPDGGKVFLLATTEITGHNKLPGLQLSVRDTGVGIPAADLGKVFDRFYQADNQDKAKMGGTGIGLSLTRELVKMMGGEITVESELGKGTTFTVWLPITNKAAESAGGVSSQSGVPSFAESTGSNLKWSAAVPKALDTAASILLIEDNSDVVEYLAACLGEHYRLDYAYNGRAGIEKALETAPDLIISDLMMPEKDGLEVCDQLKNDERTSHIPIILLTARADMESRIAGLRKGADAYLAKPFHREELLVTLQNLLEQRRKLQAKYANVALTAEPFAALSAPAEMEDVEHEFLLKLRSIIEENLSDANLDVDMLCRKIGMGRTNLHNKLSALTGFSTTIYVRKLRLQRAKELLLSTSMNVSEIAWAVGFNDPKFFSRVFAEEFGAPPSTLNKR